MRGTLILVAAFSFGMTSAAAAQRLTGVPLGSELRVWTVDYRFTNRPMYLIDIRTDTLLLRDVPSRQPVQLLQASVERLDAFRPGRPRRERANLIAGYSALACGLLAAALPIQPAAHRGEYAFMGATGCSAIGVPKLKGALWHAYRRKWATERKDLPLRDVMAAGGWKDVTTLLTSYPDLLRRRLQALQ